MSRFVTTLIAGAMLLGSTAAFAADQIGIPVSVFVTNPDGDPIPTAVVRHPDEAERHRVNTLTGEWRESVLYLQDGSELVFEKGMELQLEISAPGYLNQKIRYIIRKRKNKIPVVLQPMAMEADEDDMEMGPVIQFGRDKPIE